REATRIDPNAIVALTQLVHVELRMGRVEKAMEIANAACEVHPDRIPLLLARRRVHLRMGKRKEANNDWKLAQEIDTSLVPELLTRASATADLPNLDATNDALRARSLEGETNRVLVSLMTIHVKRHEYQEAIEALDQLRRQQPDELQHVVDQAVLMARLKRGSECRDLLAMLDGGDANGLVFYQAACASSLLGKPHDQDRALYLLSESILSGYLPLGMRQDPDLIALWGRPEFEALAKTCDLKRSAGSRTPVSSLQTPP
ncbi:MAG: hypothetical protein AAGD07_06635, partial [Planctomycetota bacterium]